jgi:hypothetical protein
LRPAVGILLGSGCVTHLYGIKKMGLLILYRFSPVSSRVFSWRVITLLFLFPISTTLLIINGGLITFKLQVKFYPLC